MILACFSLASYFSSRIMSPNAQFIKAQPNICTQKSSSPIVKARMLVCLRKLAQFT